LLSEEGGCIHPARGVFSFRPSAPNCSMPSRSDTVIDSVCAKCIREAMHFWRAPCSASAGKPPRVLPPPRRTRCRFLSTFLHSSPAFPLPLRLFLPVSSHYYRRCTMRPAVFWHPNGVPNTACRDHTARAAPQRPSSQKVTSDSASSLAFSRLAGVIGRQGRRARNS